MGVGDEVSRPVPEWDVLGISENSQHILARRRRRTPSRPLRVRTV